MLQPFHRIALPIVLAISFPNVAMGLSSAAIAQIPILQPPPPPGLVKGGSDDVPLCYMRISGSTVNLHQLCGTPPNQAPKTTVPGSPNRSDRSNSSSSIQGSSQREPVSFGTGSAYADDRR